MWPLAFDIQKFDASTWSLINGVLVYVNRVYPQVLDINAGLRLVLKEIVAFQDLALFFLFFLFCRGTVHHVQSWLRAYILYTIL